MSLADILALLFILTLWGLFVGVALEQIGDDAIPPAVYRAAILIVSIFVVPVLLVLRAGEVVGRAIKDTVDS